MKEVDVQMERRSKRFNFLEQYILTRKKINYGTSKREELRRKSEECLKMGDKAQASLCSPSNFYISETDIRSWKDEADELYKAIASLL